MEPCLKFIQIPNKDARKLCHILVSSRYVKSSFPEMSLKKAVLKNVVKLVGKKLQWSPFFK